MSTKRKELWNECFEWARRHGPIDSDSLVTLSEALLDRDVDASRHMLNSIAECLSDEKPIPRIYARWLANALQAIAAGADSAQTLLLKSNARKRTKSSELIHMFFAVEWHKENGAKFESEAIRVVAQRLGLKVPTAKKRYANAQAQFGPVLALLRSTMREIGARKGIRAPTLGEAIGGAIPENPGDQKIREMLAIIGAPAGGLIGKKKKA